MFLLPCASSLKGLLNFLIYVFCVALSLSSRWLDWASPPSLSLAALSSLMPWVQIMNDCQHGTRRPKASEWAVSFIYLHVQIKPPSETCGLAKTGYSSFSGNANKRGTRLTGLNHDLSFTELAGSWLCFNIYLHNCSACYSHSGSRNERAFMLVSRSEL